MMANQPEVLGTFYGYPVIVCEDIPGSGPWALVSIDPEAFRPAPDQEGHTRAELPA